MVEELHRDSLSDRAASDPSTVGAWLEAGRLEDRPVYDVNGVMVGKITRCFAEEGSIVRCDVTLSDNAKGILGTDQEVAGLPSSWITNVAQDGVHLMHAGEELVRPENPRPLGAARDLRGADDLPRKER